MEVGQVGSFAPQERPQSRHTILGPERSRRHFGLAEYSTFRNFAIVRGIFQDFVTGTPQQFVLPEKNLVFPARLTIEVVGKE